MPTMGLYSLILNITGENIFYVNIKHTVLNRTTDLIHLAFLLSL